MVGGLYLSAFVCKNTPSCRPRDFSDNLGCNTPVGGNQINRRSSVRRMLFYMTPPDLLMHVCASQYKLHRPLGLQQADTNHASEEVVVRRGWSARLLDTFIS